MTSPEKLATPDSVMALAEKLATKNHLVERDQSSYAMRERQDARDALRAEVEALATQRQGEGENRKIAQLIIDNDRAGAVKWATGLIGNFDGPSCRIDPDATSQGVAVARPDAPPAIKNKGVAFRDWETHPLYKSATAMGHFDAGWMRCLAATTSKD